MPPSSEADAPPARWAAWLHALWGMPAELAWQVVDASARPVLTGRAASARALHLPAPCDDRTASAAAAHAAAHWRFGGEAQPRAGLKPVQQALFAVLEDARIEWLALQELPGLRALWLPFHRGEDAPGGNGFEALLARLARSLLEREALDPHPWIAKARGEFFAGGSLAVDTPAKVRALASRLGNDIGQMRLPFNARTYRPHAAYRDDGSWLWEAEPAAPDSDTTLAAKDPERDPAGARELPQPPEGTPVRYPEWDVRIARYRADWCQVYASTAAAVGDGRGLLPGAGERRRLTLRIEGLRGRVPVHAGRAAIGNEFHPMALLDARLQRLAGRAPDERVYRRETWPPPRLAVQVLLDTSASTADPGPHGVPVLQDLVTMALASVVALEAAGHSAALLAFSSRTRQRVELRHLKHWHERADAPEVLARCAAQRGAGSTRMGAALRHATEEVSMFVQRGARQQPVVLLLTDGDAHDIDVPDPAYLVGDLRRAVAEAERRGVAVGCLQLGAAGALRRTLAGRHALLRSPQGLAAALLPLLAA